MKSSLTKEEINDICLHNSYEWMRTQRTLANKAADRAIQDLIARLSINVEATEFERILNRIKETGFI